MSGGAGGAAPAKVPTPFGCSVGSYGRMVVLRATHAARGWPVSLVSAAVTGHFLPGAYVVANLAALHRRFGLVAVTRAAGVAAALGCLGRVLAREPWQLFVATLLTGLGRAARPGRRRSTKWCRPSSPGGHPTALGTAYDCENVGAAWRA